MTGSDRHSQDPQPAPAGDVGGVAEEAAKLLGVLDAWSREHGQALAAVATAAGRAPRGGADADDQGSADTAGCSVFPACPLCRSVAFAARSVSPQVREHLRGARGELLAAALGLLEAATAPPPEANPDEDTDEDTDVAPADRPEEPWV